MSGKFNQAVKDIIPTYHENIPSKLLSHIESLYQLSLREKPNLGKSEIARFHICTFLAVERFQQHFELPDPETRRIPLPPKTSDKLITEFRDNLVIKSASNTPNSSPRKSTPKKQNTPRFAATTPKISSPLKRLQSLQGSPTPKRKKTDLHDEESPFNPKKGAEDSKKGLEEDSLKDLDDSESSVKSSPTKYVYDRKHVTIIDLIQATNYFRIPASITPMIIQCFLQHKYKFTKKSEWLLTCGLLHSAYIRIYHKNLSSKIGAEAEFVDILFNYQRGGLTKWNLQLWCKIVEDWIKDEPWILDIEQTYMYGDKSFDKQYDQQRRLKIGGDWSLLETFGSMITGDVLLDLQCQDQYYNTWTKNVLKQSNGK